MFKEGAAIGYNGRVIEVNKTKIFTFQFSIIAYLELTSIKPFSSSTSSKFLSAIPVQ